MTENKLITSRLIECREKTGISKREAAKRINVSQPAYLRYESGERTPSIQVIKEIAKVFHTSPDYLTGKTDSPKITTYIIDAEEDPELYDLVNTIHTNPETYKRLMSYYKMLKNDIQNI